MPSHLAGPWNQAVSFLEMLFGDVVLATGTGFFWRENERTYLITNWHNLSGRNPETLAPLSEHGGVPDRLKFMAFKKASETDAEGFYQMTIKHRTVPLNEDGKAVWFEHGQFGRSVDVAALDVTTTVADLMIAHANEVEDDAVLSSYASQDVFILGFPLGMITGVPAPVWKRGSIASDPNFEPGGLPKVIVDTATRPGMSGSVVLARHIVVGRPIPKKDGTMTKAMLYAKQDIVLGIYSGRIGAGEIEAQLGIVWRRNTIVETIQKGKRAAH